MRKISTTDLFEEAKVVVDVSSVEILVNQLDCVIKRIHGDKEFNCRFCR